MKCTSLLSTFLFLLSVGASVTEEARGESIIDYLLDTKSKSVLNSPGKLAFDAVNNRLFVQDGGNGRILVFDVAPDSIRNDEAASYVLGQPDFTLPVPQQGSRQHHCTKSRFGALDMAYDSANSRLFVIDDLRVLILNVAPDAIANGEDPSYVLGQPDFTSCESSHSDSGMISPYGLAYDPEKAFLYVADFPPEYANKEMDMHFNHRVMQFNVAPATITNGETANSFFLNRPIDQNSIESGLNKPGSFALDTVHHRQFVADRDYGYIRVLVYNLNADNSLPVTNGALRPAYVLGQPDFVTKGPNNFVTKGADTSQSTMNYPKALAYDAVNDRLFVADGEINNRVLVFDTSTITNGMKASYVLGKADFDHNTLTDMRTCTQASLDSLYDIAYDSANARLFVSESLWNRVLVYNVAPTTIANGENASYVLGQPDFTSCNPNQVHPLM